MNDAVTQKLLSMIDQIQAGITQYAPEASELARVAIYNPKLYLAHQIIEKVVK